jgi:sec-independent protein translocase protein TatC
MSQPAKEMSFLEHLEELRWTLVRSAIAIAAGMVAIFIYVQEVFEQVVMAPAKPDFITYRFLCSVGHRLGMGEAFCVKELALHIQNTTMEGQFMMSFSIAFTGGLIAASPFVIWQLWRFIAPGLKAAERAAVRGTVFYVILLFLLGTAFAYYVLAPMSIQFFSAYSLSSTVENKPTLTSYIGVLNSFLLWTGLVFQLPVIMVFLARIGIVGSAFLRVYRKHAFVVILVVAAVITPPDVVSQVTVTLPLVALYELSILLTARTERRQLRMAGAPATPTAR